MARSVNCVHLIGNLTRDPELRHIPSGKPVCSIGLATNRNWTDGSGEKKEVTEFHKIILWGKLAEIASQYLQKGMKAYFQGRIQTRSYTTPDGVHKFITEIIAEDMMMLSGDPGKRGPKEEDAAEAPQAKAASDAAKEEPEATSEQASREAEIVDPDEIPF